MGKLIDCKKYHSDILMGIKQEIKQVWGVPRMLIVSVGYDPAGKAYIKGKTKDAEMAEILCSNLVISPDYNTDEAVKIVKNMIDDFNPHGMIVQLPTNGEADVNELLKLVDDSMDIDGFNITSDFEPCTPLGIMRLLQSEGIDVAGKHVVILGRSQIVGQPLARLMVNSDATVTICHSKSKNITGYTTQADILVSCTGQKHLVKPNMIKDDCILIDVGITRGEDGKLYGDISPECYDKSSYYTTVPGGIGLVTRATLMQNLVQAWKNS